MFFNVLVLQYFFDIGENGLDDKFNPPFKIIWFQ